MTLREQSAAAGFRNILIASETPAAGARLQRAAELIRCDAGSTIHSVHAERSRHDRKGALDDILAEAAAGRADLVVMGGHSHVLASRAAMIAPCPVLMMPGDTELSLRNILVPVDFSSHSRDALLTAAALSQRAEGSLSCVFVESEDAPWHALRAEETEHEQKRAAVRSFASEALGGQHYARCFAEPLQASAALLHNPGLSLAHAIQGADIAYTIEQVAERLDADLIVVGTRGRSCSAAILLGSVTEKLIQFAQRPVLAVKPPGSQLGLLDLLLGRGWGRVEPQPGTQGGSS